MAFHFKTLIDHPLITHISNSHIAVTNPDQPAANSHFNITQIMDFPEHDLLLHSLKLSKDDGLSDWASMDVYTPSGYTDFAVCFNTTSTPDQPHFTIEHPTTSIKADGHSPCRSFFIEQAHIPHVIQVPPPVSAPPPHPPVHHAAIPASFGTTTQKFVTQN
ncbi:hypothetical protein BDQ17DRAFT_1436086 [Cyathus striatus]|nr:hypothetical protein BDQ17DRAFT_1436086 [Cyathus striatus]